MVFENCWKSLVFKSPTSLLHYIWKVFQKMSNYGKKSSAPEVITRPACVQRCTTWRVQNINTVCKQKFNVTIEWQYYNISSATPATFLSTNCQGPWIEEAACRCALLRSRGLVSLDFSNPVNQGGISGQCTFAHDKVHKLDKLSYTESPVLWQSKRILKRTGKEEGRRRRGSMLVAGGKQEVEWISTLVWEVTQDCR